MDRGDEFPASARILVCENCGGPLEAAYDYEALGSNQRGLPVDKDREGIWRYSPLLPLSAATRIVTLGEGGTPLVRVSRVADALGMREVYAKDESRNPTLSFKDRKSSVAITKAAEFGSSGVVNMTAGNAGSSVAAYAGRAGIPAHIFTIEGISDSKLAKLLSYGATVFRTTAPTKDLMEFVDRLAKVYGLVNMTAASRYNPYVKEGCKTSVFEIFEQLGGSLPDWIIVPIGAGGNMAGIYKGLRELKLLGVIESMPKLVGVQGRDCAPVVAAFERGLAPDQIPVIENPRTVAHSILDSWTPDGDQALRAIRETGGLALGVTDDDILVAMKELSSREGLYLEPAGAAPLAALSMLVAAGTVRRDESVVLMATGSGSNQPEATISAWGRPPAFELDVAAFGRYLHGEA